MEFNMTINDAKRISIYAKRCFCINPKSAKHLLDIRGTSVFESPGDSCDINHIQEV